MPTPILALVLISAVSLASARTADGGEPSRVGGSGRDSGQTDTIRVADVLDVVDRLPTELLPPWISELAAMDARDYIAAELVGKEVRGAATPMRFWLGRSDDGVGYSVDFGPLSYNFGERRGIAVTSLPGGPFTFEISSKRAEILQERWDELSERTYGFSQAGSFRVDLVSVVTGVTTSMPNEVSIAIETKRLLGLAERSQERSSDEHVMTDTSIERESGRTRPERIVIPIEPGSPEDVALQDFFNVEKKSTSGASSPESEEPWQPIDPTSDRINYFTPEEAPAPISADIAAYIAQRQGRDGRAGSSNVQSWLRFTNYEGLPPKPESLRGVETVLDLVERIPEEFRPPRTEIESAKFSAWIARENRALKNGLCFPVHVTGTSVSFLHESDDDNLVYRVGFSLEPCINHPAGTHRDPSSGVLLRREARSVLTAEGLHYVFNPPDLMWYEDCDEKTAERMLTLEGSVLWYHTVPKGECGFLEIRDNSSVFAEEVRVQAQCRRSGISADHCVASCRLFLPKGL